MSREDNLKTLHRFVTEIKERGNPAAADEVLHENYEHHFPFPGLPPGRDGFNAVTDMIYQGFDDVKVTVEFTAADGDLVVERSQASAKHTGEFLGVPATNRTVYWSEIHIYKMEDGRIREHWPEANFLGVMNQIGPQTD